MSVVSEEKSQGFLKSDVAIIVLIMLKFLDSAKVFVLYYISDFLIIDTVDL